LRIRLAPGCGATWTCRWRWRYTGGMQLHRFVLAGWLAGCCALGAAESPARAQDDVATAKAHYTKATRLYEVGEYRQSLDEFKAAHLAKPDAAFLYNIAQCHRQLGDLEQAVVMYKRYLAASPEATNRPEVEKRIAEIEAKLATAKKMPSPPAWQSPTGAAVAPNPNVTGAKPQGSARTQAAWSPDAAPAGRTPPVTGAVLAQSEPAGASLRGWRWVGVGATLALAGAAIGTGLSASSKYDDLKKSCGETVAGCDEGQIDAVKSRALVTNVLWSLAGVAAIGTGVMFYLTPGSAAAQIAWRF
jgi:tetratricopeptide (TPR) repeat protein